MLSSAASRKLFKEIAALGGRRTPGDNFRVEVDERDALDFTAWIRGPEGTPYTGGYFKIQMDFAKSEYPARPPKAQFGNKVFHPNVSEAGDICVNSLQKDWKSTMGIQDILNVIFSLLMDANPDSALNAEASDLIHENWDEYVRIAKLWTSVYAAHVPACYAASTSPLPAPSSSSTKSSPKASTSARLEAATPLQVSSTNTRANAPLSAVAPPNSIHDSASGKVEDPASVKSSATTNGAGKPSQAAKKTGSTTAGAKRGLKRL